jgi:hypothetical protein
VPRVQIIKFNVLFARGDPTFYPTSQEREKILPLFCFLWAICGENACEIGSRFSFSV